MSGTRQFGNAPRNALPLSPVGRWVLLLAGLAALGWGLVALLGSTGVVGPLVGLVLAVYWTSDDRSPAARAEQRAVTAALREHRDPGPAFRPVVTSTASRQLAASAIDRWGPSVVLAGVAVACVGTAMVREQPWTALPAAPLAILAVLVLLLVRRADALADLWVADPPVPATDEANR